MPRLVSINPDEFFGGGTPALEGRAVLGDAYFTIFSRKEKSGEDDSNQKSPKVYCVWPVQTDDRDEPVELRFSVGYSVSRDGKRQWWPGSDAETLAKAANDKEGPRGPFLLWANDDTDPRSLSEEYDRFPTFMRKLQEAGVPAEVFTERYPEEGLAAFSGIAVELTHEIPEYEREADDGKKTTVKGQPFNFPMPGSAEMPDEKGSKSSKGSKGAKEAKGSKSSKAAKAAKKDEPAVDVDTAKVQLFEAIAAKAKEQVESEEEVTREIASRWASSLNKEAELGLAINVVMAVSTAVKGKGKEAEMFDMALDAEGLTASSAGVISASE